MIVTAGSTNVSVYYYITGNAAHASPGDPVTGLLFSDIETGGSASYVRQGAVRTDLTLITLASASAAHSDGGFILVDDTNMPGVYRCDYPDAAFATGVDQVALSIVVATAKNAVAAPILVDIADFDLRTATQGVDLVSISGTSAAADNLELDYNGTGYAKTNSTLGTVTLVTTTTAVTNQVTANATAISGSSAAADAMEVNYTGTVTAFDGLNDLSAANVNTEVADVLKTDTVTEPTQGIPPLAATMEDMITYLYLEYVRNKVIVDNTAGDKEVYADDGTTVLYRKTLSDTGSILTVAEATSGP